MSCKKRQHLKFEIQLIARERDQTGVSLSFLVVLQIININKIKCTDRNVCFYFKYQLKLIQLFLNK